jgi:hypothetical protein
MGRRRPARNCFSAAKNAKSGLQSLLVNPPSACFDPRCAHSSRSCASGARGDAGEAPRSASPARSGRGSNSSSTIATRPFPGTGFAYDPGQQPAGRQRKRETPTASERSDASPGPSLALHPLADPVRPSPGLCCGNMCSWPGRAPRSPAFAELSTTAPFSTRSQRLRNWRQHCHSESQSRGRALVTVGWPTPLAVNIVGV